MGFQLISMHFQSNIVPDPGFVPFFEQKIQGPLKDTFCFFQGLHSVQKKILESMLFFSSSTSREFYPKGLCACSFSFAVLLKLLSQHIEIQGHSSTNCNFQGLSRSWIFFLKFKDFRGFSRCMQTLQTCFHRWMEIAHILFIVNSLTPGVNMEGEILCC